MPYAILPPEGQLVMSATVKRAVVHLVGEELFVGISPSGHALTIDTDRSRNSAPSPVELLLLALGSCTGVDVAGILKKKREQVSSYRIELSGVRRDEHPRAFTRIEVKHILEGKDLSEKAVAAAIELSDKKYCSVAATLRPAAEIVSTFEIIQAGE